MFLSPSNELQKLSNTTYLLDTLLSEDKYDRQIRPGIGGPPIVIRTDIEIRSFGPISESERVYSMDCYFRQTWFDKRLKFFSHKEVLSMDWKFLQKVWIPDTYFLNGKSSYLHKITVPNKFIRLRNDGQLKYSMRLTVKASCPMHLRKYPLDTQACPLEIGSYAYPSQDVLYTWNGNDAVLLSKDVVLSQYDFVNITISNRTHTVKVGGKV
ncbi:gamma-aminobutyric acid receptor alpha-like [Trichonephila clavipes]|uniref:Gamma-aminobutyric acid receptor alpha-like n=1 Tax=Trichonephila clavipes TaxID=2585209 RepID=A0A8X6SLD6_TRICX|nr:gamma-aminobutyric acid receptor alpha-like [Trichonephila clavipes]